MVKLIITRLILFLVPKKIIEILTFSQKYKMEQVFKFAQLSYSQEGEDLVLNKFFKNQTSGFFIDIGANDPIRFSNTYFFYKKGWRGINIEPNANLFKLLNETRSEDINLNIGISDEKGELEYFMFNEPALNTFSNKEKEEYLLKKEYFLIETKKLPVKTLTQVFQEQNISPSKEIDFINIDAEGLDFQVLKSFDLSVYSPKIILIEILNIEKLKEVFNHEIYIYLSNMNYDLQFRTGNTFFFKKNSQ